MLKKLSKSRKKKNNPKLANSRSKLIKQPRKDHKQIKQHKQIKIPAKSNHHASTLTLLSHHNASQCSLLGEHKSTVVKKAKSKNRESSISMIYKDVNDGGNKQKQKSKNPKDNKKSKKNSSVNPNSRSKKNIVKISPQKDKNQKVLKQNPVKKSKIQRQQQLYQRINIGLYKSKTNSEINFSNNSSVRQNNNNDSIYNPNKPKKNLTIDCSDEYILNQYFSNSRIKNQQKKRIQAAIKIQKVFRGYLTRKMLQQYIEKQQLRLQQLSRKIKYSSSRQSGNKDSTEYEILQKSKSNRKNKNQQFRQDDSDEKIRRFTKQKVSHDIFLQNESSNKKQYLKQPLSIDISLKNSRRQGTSQVDHGSLEQQSSIYGQHQDSLSKYLPFEQKYINQSSDQSFLFQKQPSPYKKNINFQQKSQKREQQQYYTYDQVKQKLKQRQKQKQQKSQQYFKYTPAVSSYASKTKGEDPIPTDFSQKRVQQFQYEISVKSRQLQVNYNKKINHVVSQIQYSYGTQYPQQNIDISHKNNVQELKGQYESKQIKNDNNINQDKRKEIINKKIINTKQEDLIKMLKKQEKQKWGKIIQMLSYQMIQAKSRNEVNQKLLNMILQFSKKNKQQLEKSNSNIGEESNQFKSNQQKTQQISYQNIKDQNKLKNKDFIVFKKPKKQQYNYPSRERTIEQQQSSNLSLTKQQIQKQNNKNFHKNQDMPLIHKKLTNLNINIYSSHMPNHSHSNTSSSGGSNKQNYSLLQKTQQLKIFYRNNMPAYPIQQMIQIREKALQKREKQMVNKLNQDMYNTKLTHEQFIARLSQMQQNFEKQRQLINKAKMQIFIGHRATHKLMQDSFKDAWYLGFKIPFSQSLKDFKGNNNNNIWIKQIIVDQLKSYSNNLNNSSHSIKNISKINNNNIQQESSILQESNKKQQISYIQHSTQKQSQKKRQIQIQAQDLSIQIPHQDSSLTIRAQSKSQQISQQSVYSYSQDISYNQGEVQINNLGIQPRATFMFDQDFSEEQQQNQPIQGFKKVNPDKLKFRSPFQYSDLEEGTLLLDPDQQQEIDNQVMRKISLNQRKKSANQYLQSLDNLRKSEMTPRHSQQNNQLINKNISPRPSYLMKPKSQVYNVDLSQQSGEDQVIFNEEMDPQVKQITQEQVIKLIWEAAGQIYMNTFMRSKFCKNRNRAPQKISDQERYGFIRQLQNQIPSYGQLLPRLNQKMTASRLQLLKFMRISFEAYQSPRQDRQQNGSNDSLDQSSQGLQQIGKFQHIFPSDMCLNALNKYMQQQQLVEMMKLTKQNQEDQQQIKDKMNLILKEKVPQQCIKKVSQRQRNFKYNQRQKNQLRKQIQKIQFHCIFDSFNQILMRKRLKFEGYSGIGLNELTMIMSRQNIKQLKKQEQFTEILQNSKKQLIQLVGNDKSSNQKLLLENYEKLCENDSQWIYYTQQALSFALQFVFMLEDQIFFEETAVLFKRLKGF